jgi:hypothetical protein
MKCIDLEENKRIYVDQHRLGELWFNFSGDFFHVATPITYEQAQKLIVALQEVMEPPAYVVRLTTSFNEHERYSARREEHQTENDPVGFGRTEQEAIDDLEEKIDQS